MAAITLDWIRRQHAAVEADAATYQKNYRDADGNKISRNKNTAQRGITYIESTDRYRTFAHTPFYQYVGTFTALQMAVQARDAYEAQARAKLEAVFPELAPGAVNERNFAVHMRRRPNSRVVDVTVRSDYYAAMALFVEYDDILRWLKAQRVFL